MQVTTSVEKAGAFRAMHQPGNPIVLINVWDVASARVVADKDGAQAIATASWSICAANGFADGGDLPLEVALAAARRIGEAAKLPVTVDFEKGYADSAAGVRENTLRLIETGAIGLNLEGSSGADDGELWSVGEAAARAEGGSRCGRRRWGFAREQCPHRHVGRRRFCKRGD